MKKGLVIVFAAIGMMACVQNDTVELSPSHEIRFGSKYVDNQTRAAQDPSFVDGINDLTAFNVWGFMDKPEVKLWEAEEVTKKADGGWSQDNVHYWLPGHSYYFTALAPMNSPNWSVDTSNTNTFGLGKVTFTNVDGSEDLIYAATTMKTPDTYDELFANPMDSVRFKFDHLLTKLTFTFKNNFPVPEDDETIRNVKMKIKNVTMEAPRTATIDLAVENWKNDDIEDWKFEGDKMVLNFGDTELIEVGETKEISAIRLTYPTPSTYTYTVEFDIEIYMNEVLGMTAHKEATISNRELLIDKAYRFNAVIDPENLTLKKIEFGVPTINGWNEQEPQDMVN